MIITTPNNNTIEISNTFTGKEIIKYNSKEISVKRTIAGGIHLFEAKENNETVNYEVELKIRWHGFGYYVNVRRNGVLIFSNK